MVHLSLLLPLSLIVLAAADPIRIPLTRRSIRDWPLERYAGAADHIRAKYGFETLSSKLQKRGQTGGISLINQVRKIYPSLLYSARDSGIFLRKGICRSGVCFLNLQKEMFSAISNIAKVG